MRRRDFIVIAGSAAAAWPLSSLAQQSGRARRIGVLVGLVEGSPEAAKYSSTFQEALRGLGWAGRQNVQIQFRAAAHLEGTPSQAIQLVSLGPEAIVSYTAPATNAGRQATR